MSYCEKCSKSVFSEDEPENVPMKATVNPDWVANELKHLDRETKKMCLEMSIASYVKYKVQGENEPEFTGTAMIIRRAAGFYNYISGSKND